MRVDLKKLRIAMARNCMGAPGLAEKANLNRGTVYHVLEGKNFNLSTIGKIAQALGVDVTEIIED